ncbi:MAG: phosphoenolpyruvate mutase [Rhodospirillaceae bacterium]|nr:phosphoenolpyruvate mutase [Rhodospirillaceae bacterium]|tara:strand:+ start:894 stop:2207 length:1314 start_codon:yes stop_codon:yes gene_type:complete
MVKKNNSVYIGMTADILHHGLIKIIAAGRELGPVTIGLLTDKAVSTYKPLPYLDFEQRKSILENIVGVDRVVEQNDWDFVPNLRKYKPGIVMHGDDWVTGSQKTFRNRVVDVIKEWDGRLIEVPYTRGVNTARYDKQMSGLGNTSEIRRTALKRYLDTAQIVRAIEVHSPLCGRLAETVEVEKEEGVARFEAMWVSSLTDSTIRGKPDTELVDTSSRINAVDALFEVTTKPLIFDGDTGGLPEHFVFNVRTLERLGASAIIIEDKTGPKRNSLLQGDGHHILEDRDLFAEKIQMGKAACVTNDFMIIGRLESLIVGAGMEDALDRAAAYTAAGADGIMIHSRSEDPSEVLNFCDRFRDMDSETTLVVVPTKYSVVTEPELKAHGVNIVIYANHMLRASVPAMREVCSSILRNSRAKEADELCLPVNELLDLIPNRVL